MRPGDLYAHSTHEHGRGSQRKREHRRSWLVRFLRKGSDFKIIILIVCKLSAKVQRVWGGLGEEKEREREKKKRGAK